MTTKKEAKKLSENKDTFEPDMDFFDDCIACGDMQGAMDCFGDRDPIEFL